MQKGITLIETVVAVTVLIFALGGPFLLAAKSLRSAAYAREEIAASRLAEEGLEVVHSMRDNNSAETDGGTPLTWMQGMLSCVGVECTVDISQKTGGGSGVSIWNPPVALTACGGPCTGNAAAVCQLSSGIYRQFSGGGCSGSWVDTGMRRIIRIKQVGGNGNKEYSVEVEVDYPAGGQMRKVILRDALLNWFPPLPVV